ncbi:LapA family protein [Allocoleopsis sp.]|uniref:LapA family protein n=1 Tax=Allocoleopsis sp. TaxID=3088169 RepID=UPI002FD33D98
MRQINFLIIFAMCLALVLFSLQNTEPAVIRIINGVQVQAPLAIELILAMGLGAILAWLFSIWARLQQQLDSLKSKRQIRTKEQKIEQLEQDIERYKAELEQLQLPALSASTSLTEEVAG